MVKLHAAPWDESQGPVTTAATRSIWKSRDEAEEKQNANESRTFGDGASRNCGVPRSPSISVRSGQWTLIMRNYSAWAWARRREKCGEQACTSSRDGARSCWQYGSAQREPRDALKAWLGTEYGSTERRSVGFLRCCQGAAKTWSVDPSLTVEVGSISTMGMNMNNGLNLLQNTIRTLSRNLGAWSQLLCALSGRTKSLVKMIQM